MRSRMYRENRRTLNWFIGCNYNCIYCKPSFQAQMKRQKQRCLKCYYYEPHAHLERLLKPPPKTSGDEFIFFPSSGDPAFATAQEFCVAIDYTRKYPDTTFLFQSKNPACFVDYKFPDNVILGTTIETNRTFYLNNPSKTKNYWEISYAPVPSKRIEAMMQILHKRKFVTIEPILTFNSWLVSYISIINPEFVYVGYENHGCKLPEPSLAKTERLISDLEVFTEVRVKTLRKAWWEK